MSIFKDTQEPIGFQIDISEFFNELISLFLREKLKIFGKANFLF